MFCENCGSPIPDGSKFCPKCGSPVPPQAENQPSLGKPPLPKGAIIGIVVAAVAVCIIVIVLVVTNMAPSQQSNATSSLSGQSQAAASSTSSASSSASSSSDESRSADPTTVRPANSQQSSGTSFPSISPSQPLLNLTNPDDYYNLNIFLSNFTEWPSFYENAKTYDRNNYDLQQLVNWGMWHNAINNSGTLVTEGVDVPGAPASLISKGLESIAPTYYPRHMETALIVNSISRYMGIDVNLSGYNPGDGSYFERNGVMYEGHYRGAADFLDNVALADSVKDNGGNTVFVNFTVHCGNNSATVVSDKSWYGLDGASLDAAMRAAGSNRIVTKAGTAVVEVVGTGSDRTFKLVSFQVDDVR